jgi:CDP-diacylglycerol---serine O-phosphatidyltransferase
MDKQTLKRSGQVLAPSLFTVGNMACGFFSLLASHQNRFTPAATAILLGAVFDSLDGRVARLVHGESAFGVEFDSLADFLTFGVAPAHMMYAFILKDYGSWGYPLAFLYALCAALRLARFNAVAHETGGSKTHFQGLPSPAGAGFLCSFVLLYQIVEEEKPVHTWKPLMEQVPMLFGLTPLMVLIIGFLMISTIPFLAFKKGSLQKPELEDVPGRRVSFLPPRSIKILLGFVVGGLVFFNYPQTALFLICLLYVISGPAALLVKGVRALLGIPPSPPADPA